jgi:phosphoribosylaminoimidazolecarboxamide formyltransferase / IMP cyclohydrolase
MKPISRAIMSVTDKSGLVDFASALATFPIEVLSTGGTAKALREAGLQVREVSDFTGFPEMLDGRVKTLHPKIHGGILGRRDLPDHTKQMQAHQILPIDLVVVNLYQFEQAVAKPGCTLEDAIENIDIGGPAMLRSSAKNFKDVTVIVDPADYPLIIKEMQANQGATTLATRFNLARKVFKLTSAYDGAIYHYLEKVTSA